MWSKVKQFGRHTRFSKASLLVFGMSVFMLLAGCSLFPVEDEPLSPPLIKPARESFNLHEVGYGDVVQGIRGSGYLESTKVAYHRLSHNEIVKEVLVKSGDRVEAGDLLISFEDGELELDIRRQEIVLERARLNLDQAKDEGNTRMIRIRTMELELETLNHEALQARMVNKQLIAEISGQVTFVEALQPGETAAAKRSLVQIADPTQLQIVYRVSSATEVNEVEVGMQAQLVISKKELGGEVVQTPSSAPRTDDPQLAERYNRTLLIASDAIPPEAGIGTTVQIHIVTQQKENVLIIPKRALRSYFGRDYVQILDGETRREQDVEKGIGNATEWEIVKGLEEGQQIILP